MKILQNENLTITTLPQIGQPAPSFTAESTLGTINFPEDYAGKWVALGSYPSDFCPSCTSEFLAIAKNFDLYDDLGLNLIAFNTDSVRSHKAWVENIKELNGENIEKVLDTFPIISDSKKIVARQYGLIRRGSDDPSTIRGLFIIDPEGIVQASTQYPEEVGRGGEELRRLFSAIKETYNVPYGTPTNWKPGDKKILLDPEEIELVLNDPEKKQKQCPAWFLCFEE